jgi:type VI secretion system protein ImpJ
MLLNVKNSEYLNGTLRGLVQLLVSRSGQLAGARRQKNQSLADFGTSDIANFWLLYTISTHLPAFHQYFEAAQLHPEVLYSEMAALAGSLTTFSTSIQPRDLPRYDHEHQGQCFGVLDSFLRELLEAVVPNNFIALPLKHPVAGHGVKNSRQCPCRAMITSTINSTRTNAFTISNSGRYD